MLPGMSEAIPEWNWWCDPVAVQQVLAAEQDAAPSVVPAEVTFRTLLAEADIDLLTTGDPLSQLLAALCREWLRAQAEDFDLPDPRVVLHDPLAAAVLVRPELCTWADRTASVDDRGQSTVTDPSGGGTKIRAAVDVDPPAVSAELLSVLGVGAS